MSTNPEPRPSVSKKSPTSLLLAAIATLALTASLPVFAASSTWTGTTNGTWDTTTAANWGGTAFSSTNDALFTGTPTNNVTAATGLTIGAITLDNTFTGSVSMTGANTVGGATTISGGTLRLASASGLGTSAVTVNSGGKLWLNAGVATYSNAISGAGLIELTPSTDTATMTGNLSGFTGTLSVLSGGTTFGKLAFGNVQGNQLSSSATIQVQSGATVYLNNALNYAAKIELLGTGGPEPLGALRIENGNQTGAVTLKGNTTIGTNSGTGTISGAIGESGGSFGFTKVGNGILALSNSNNYSGTTTINAGTLSVGHNSALGSGSVAFNGGTLAASTGVTLANNLSTASGIANINASGGTIVLNGNITGLLGATLTATNKITLAGTNSFATTTANSFANLNINAGAGGVDITGSTTVGTNGSINSNTNGYLNIAGTVTTTIQSGGSLAIYGSSGAPGSIVGQNAAGTSTLVVNGGSLIIGGNTGFSLGNNVNTATGVLTISSGTATITRGSTTATDARSFIALGRDNATGIINLNGGVLATDRNFVRDGSSGGTAGSGTANFVFGGGTLKALATQTDWLNSSLINTHQQALSSVTTTSAASTIDSNGFAVGINTAITGAGGFHIVDSSATTGIVNFGGAAYAYTGATSVDSGTFNTNRASVAFSGNLAVAGGKLTLNGTGAGAIGVVNFTMSSGTWTVSLDDTVSASGNMTITGGTLNVAAFNGLETLYDPSGGYALFTSIGGTGAVSGLSITGYNTTDYVASLSNAGVLSFAAIPEPSTYAAIAGALALGAVTIRRRRTV